MLNWTHCPFDRLTVRDLYQILKLRQDVFVIEQSCIYPDLDNLDERCVHLFGKDSNQQIKAYLRIIPPGVKRDIPAMGRIVVAPDVRGRNIAYFLMDQGIMLTGRLYPEMDLFVSAQEYLEKFYEKLGFVKISDMYLDDGIPHIDMVKKYEMSKV